VGHVHKHKIVKTSKETKERRIREAKPLKTINDKSELVGL